MTADPMDPDPTTTLDSMTPERAQVILKMAEILAARMAHYIPCTRNDLYARITRPLTGQDATGTPYPEGSTITGSYPVVAWTGSGDPLIAETMVAEGSYTGNARMRPASDYGTYELYALHTPPTRGLETTDPQAVVEIITGSADELVYRLPDGTTVKTVVPLWGRRADGSLTALITAEPVPSVRRVERDEHGEITGVVEE